MVNMHLCKLKIFAYFSECKFGLFYSLTFLTICIYYQAFLLKHFLYEFDIICELIFHLSVTSLLFLFFIW